MSHLKCGSKVDGHLVKVHNLAKYDDIDSRRIQIRNKHLVIIDAQKRSGGDCRQKQQQVVPECDSFVTVKKYYYFFFDMLWIFEKKNRIGCRELKKNLKLKKLKAKFEKQNDKRGSFVINIIFLFFSIWLQLLLWKIYLMENSFVWRTSSSENNNIIDSSRRKFEDLNS